MAQHGVTCPGASTGYATALQRFADAVLAEESPVAPYTNNYLGAHIRALGTTFEGVRQRLGGPVFDALAQVYARHYPAQAWDLLEAQIEGVRGEAFPWRALARLARREYAATVTYYSDTPRSRS